jgi:hypothetical protein
MPPLLYKWRHVRSWRPGGERLNKTALARVLKLAQAAEKRRRRLDGQHALLPCRQPIELTPTRLLRLRRRLNHGEPPRISRDLLILAFGYRPQEIAHGGLGKATRRKLQTMAKVSPPKSRFERTDDVARQGSDAQRRLRTALSRRRRACRHRLGPRVDLCKGRRCLCRYQEYLRFEGHWSRLHRRFEHTRWLVRRASGNASGGAFDCLRMIHRVSSTQVFALKMNARMGRTGRRHDRRSLVNNQRASQCDIS